MSTVYASVHDSSNALKAELQEAAALANNALKVYEHSS
jgi:hypothetical protein